MIKVKKILECICVTCGKLKVDEVRHRVPPFLHPLLDRSHMPTDLILLPSPQRDPAIRKLVKLIPAKDRLKYIWDKAKSKTVCEADPVQPEEGAPVVDLEEGHGGCGHNQPVIRKEGLKLFLVYKKGKGEEDVRPDPTRHARASLAGLRVCQVDS